MSPSRLSSKEKIEEEILRLSEEERCRFFVPNGPQEKMIQSVANQDNFVTIFSGGNGAGKTYLMVNVLANLIWGPQNKWFNYPIFKKWPYPKRIRIGTESANVKETGAIDQAIDYWWPKGRFKANKAGMPYVSQYTSDTGWIIDKMSYEQESKEWESATIGFVAFDEPPPRDKFSASVSRLRRGGMLSIYMTPLMQSAWIMDELVDTESFEGREGTGKTSLVYADLEDNCKEHGTRGTLDHKNIERMVSLMNPEEIEARVHGKAIHLSDVILGSAFKRNFHVVPDDFEMAPGSQRFLVVDPARGKPWAMGWGWVDLRGRLVFDSEYPTADWLKCKETKLGIKDYADIIRMDEYRNGFVPYKIIDRHFANARNDYGTTLKQDLEEKFGIEFQNSYNCENEVEIGIQKVKDYLRFEDTKPIDSMNFPMMVVKERCRNIIRALERWERDGVSLKPNTMSPYKDHFDVVRYACMAGLQVDSPVIFPERKQIYALGR